MPGEARKEGGCDAAGSDASLVRHPRLGSRAGNGAAHGRVPRRHGWRRVSRRLWRRRLSWRLSRRRLSRGFPWWLFPRRFSPRVPWRLLPPRLWLGVPLALWRLLSLLRRLSRSLSGLLRAAAPASGLFPDSRLLHAARGASALPARDASSAALHLLDGDIVLIARRAMARCRRRRGRPRSAVLVERLPLDRDAVQEPPLALVVV